jgi:xylulokinase
MSLYLGFDASTQSLTALIVQIDGTARRVVFQHTLNFDRDLPEYGTTAGVRTGPGEGVVYASPIMWADALDRMLGVIAAEAGLDVENICAISGSAQQHGSVYLNRYAVATLRGLDPAAPLAGQIGTIFSRPESPVWLDSSTTAQCREIEAALGGDGTVRGITGSSASERFTGPQIRKFFQEHPDAYSQTARVHLVSSFLASLLVGDDAAVDPGDASGMNLMDLATNAWSPAAIAATAPDLESKLPPIRPSWDVVGTLAVHWQRRYTLPRVPVIAWSGDNPCSLVGTGIIRPGVIAVSLGTSDTVFANTESPMPGASHVFRAPTGDFMSLVCFRNGSLAREWVRVRHRLDWDQVAAILDERPGNDGYLMLPWLEREITPNVMEPGVRRFGFDGTDTARDVRGVIEGQMMALANHAESLGGRVEKIIATGGAATNRSLLQVMANVFGVDVYRLDVENSAALGAALRAYHGERLIAGEPVSWKTVVAGLAEPRPGHRVSPNPKHVATYAALRREYAILEALHKDRKAIC